MDGGIREAVVMEEAHLLVEQAVDDMSSGVLPLNQADQLTIQRGAQVHRPVIAVQSHLQQDGYNTTARLKTSKDPHTYNLQLTTTAFFFPHDLLHSYNHAVK